MRSLLLILAAFLLSLLTVAAVVFQQAQRAVEAQERAELAYFGSELLERLDGALLSFAHAEANRARTGLAAAPTSSTTDSAVVLARPTVQPERRASSDALAPEVARQRGTKSQTKGRQPASSLADRYLGDPELQRMVEKSGLARALDQEIAAAYRAGITAAATAPVSIAAERPRVRTVDSTTVFLHLSIMADTGPADRGALVDVPALLRELSRRHFADTPMAGFSQLTLAARGDGLAPSVVSAGLTEARGDALDLERTFTPPFDFVSARLVADAAPPSPGRATLRALLIAFGAVAVLGSVALALAVRAQVELARRRSLFASTVTHELKTPLTAIAMYVEMLEQGVAGDDASRERYFGVLKAETARLTRLIQNVLDYARLESRRRRLAVAQMDLVPLLHEARRVMAAKAQQEGFSLAVAAPAHLAARADGEAVVQILVNLVENSLKFGAGSARKEVVIFGEPESGGVRFGVRDTGPGIDPRMIGRVFDDFTRGGDATARATKGTGLGLALVRRLARAMDGRAQARNDPAGGCTVSVWLGGA